MNLWLVKLTRFTNHISPAQQYEIDSELQHYWTNDRKSALKDEHNYKFVTAGKFLSQNKRVPCLLMREYKACLPLAIR